MTPLRYLVQTLVFHWRTNLAVLLGVAAGTAVLAGALIVGDSVRGSLRDMTLARLGQVDHVLTGPRFVRYDLAREIAEHKAFSRQGFQAAAPAIILPATVEYEHDSGAAELVSRAGRVQLYGVEERGWNLIEPLATHPAPAGSEVILNSRLAAQLGVEPGERVILEVELPSDIPRDTLLGKRDETSVEWPVTVREVLPESDSAGRFGLAPDQQLPLNAFVSLPDLQEQLGLAATRQTSPNSVGKPARVNTIFVSEPRRDDQHRAADPASTEKLNQILSETLQAADLHLRVTPHPRPGYLSVESDRMILEDSVVKGAQRAGSSLEAAQTSTVMVYIANEIRPVVHGPETGAAASAKYSRYSVVAGIAPELLLPSAAAPFGPYEFVGAPPAKLLDTGASTSEGPGEIVINDWLAEDLKVAVGDELEMTWHQVGSHGELPEESARFIVRGILKLEGTQAADRGLVPEVPGITDVESFDQWQSPFPMKKVTARDELYWKAHRATPKAFVSLSTAQHLWKNRYGNATSLRVAAGPGDFAQAEETYSSALRHELQPTENGLSFRPVKFQGLQAAAGTTDFGGLFVGFSLFLILAAAILIGLLFRLGLERRAASIGLLLATGLGPKQVRRLLLGEGAVVVLLGTLAGLVAAVGYGRLMIHGLKTWWVGAIGTRFLDLHLEPASLAMGAVAAALVAAGALYWGLRGLAKIPPRRLLSGNATVGESGSFRASRGQTARTRAIACLALALVLTVGVVWRVIPNVEAFSGFSWPTIVFFVVGLLMLAGGLWMLGAWIDSDQSAAVRGNGLAGLARLGVRNAARHRSRSLLSTSLIAVATFLIVAIAAGHRNPAVEFPDRNSGNGGFTLVAESSVPVFPSLNTSAGRSKLGLDDSAAEQALKPLRQVIPFRVNPGENASCLNIYRTSQPTILGATSEMIERGGFKFADTRGDNPWTLLDHRGDDGAIPVLGDLNTLQYSLHLGIGSTLEIRREDNQPVKLRIAGMFDGSVFQGVLVMHEQFFEELFPSRVGYQYFLVDIAPDPAETTRRTDRQQQVVREVSDLLESRLTGFDAERVADRLASFLAVQNTYLSTFQALGGLGLLLGTIGLATVMLRNILERRPELALLRAVGFPQRSLAWLVMFENALLLAWGLACGTLSALLAMAPHLLSTGADLPWKDLVLLLGVVFTVGLITAFLAARAAMQTPVVATLRAQ